MFDFLDSEQEKVGGESHGPILPFYWGIWVAPDTEFKNGCVVLCIKDSNSSIMKFAPGEIKIKKEFNGSTEIDKFVNEYFINELQE